MKASKRLAGCHSRRILIQITNSSSHGHVLYTTQVQCTVSSDSLTTVWVQRKIIIELKNLNFVKMLTMILNMSKSKQLNRCWGNSVFYSFIFVECDNWHDVLARLSAIRRAHVEMVTYLSLMNNGQLLSIGERRKEHSSAKYVINFCS
jgi:hypothetical protein